jgi:outer membrane usher protein
MPRPPCLRRGFLLLLGLGLLRFPANASDALDAAPASEVDNPDLERTRDELFRAVFKHEPPKLPIEGHVVLVLDGGDRRRVKAMLSPGARDIRVEATAALEFLRPLLLPEYVDRLAARVDPQGWLDRAAFRAAGIGVAFESRRFEVVLTTTPEMRRTAVRRLDHSTSENDTTGALRPAAVSGFLNFNVKAALAREHTPAGLTEIEEAGFAADGAITVHGVTLEGSLFGQTATDPTLHRGDVRLVYDRPARALRFMAGDLVFPVIGYQSMVPMGGIGVTKDFSLQPLVHTYRTGEFNFYLERPAEVRIWLNESLASTLQLPAGAHDIRGLVPAVGQNDIRLEVEDRAGRRDLLTFAFIHNPVVLDRGRRLFSFNVGVRRTQQGPDYDYDPDEPVASASYLQGLTDETTLGGYAQADRHRTLLGLRALQNYRLGTVQFDAAASQDDGLPWGGAARVSLITLPVTSSRLPFQSTIAAELIGKNFTPLDGGPMRTDAWSLSAACSLPFGRGWTGLASGSSLSARGPGTAQRDTVALTLTKRFRGSMGASVSWRYRQERGQPSETEVRFGLHVSFSRKRLNFQATKELESDAVNVSWDTGRRPSGSAPYAFGGARADSDTQRYRVGAGYWGNLGLAEIVQTRDVTDFGNGESTRDETALRLQGALVFAESTFALSRPVTENFAIVTGRDGLEDTVLKVDPDSRGGSRARTGLFGPAVIGDILSYRVRDLRVEPVNPPMGATPLNTSFRLAAAHKSGFLLELGQPVQLVAFGRLLDAAGRPVAHLPIEVRRLDAPEAPPAVTFTGRNGAFQVPDLRPGRYEIVSTDRKREARTTIEVTASPEGLCRLGDIEFAAAE